MNNNIINYNYFRRESISTLSPFNFANVWHKYMANLAATRVTLTLLYRFNMCTTDECTDECKYLTMSSVML